MLSSSLDGTARLASTAAPDAPATVLQAHTDAITGCTLHPTGQYLVTASTDATWALFDIEAGRCLLRQSDASAAAYTCAGFHPDGLILATGMASVVRVWDVKSQANLATFEGHTGAVSCLAFSENGYYLATGSADATVKLWDLRKLKNFHTLPAPEGATAAVSSVAFDFSGHVLAVAAAGLSLYDTKAWGNLVAFPTPAAATAAAFGPMAGFFASASADGAVQLYGA